MIHTQLNFKILSYLPVALISVITLSMMIATLSFTAVSASQSETYWSKATPMPTPRSESGVVLLKGKIYVIGGQDRHVKPTDTVEVFDVKSRKWSITTPLPLPLDHIEAVSYDGRIYVIGGNHPNGISNKLLIYDPLVGKWIEGKPMLNARTKLTAKFIDGQLYAVGGVDDVHNVLNTTEAYDPKTDTWTSKAPMPTARHHMTSSVVDGKLYVIGGRLFRDGIPSPHNRFLLNFNISEMYDPVKNTWTKLEPMPTKRSGLASSSIGNDIYVFGGQSEEGAFANNERYDTKTHKWSSEDPLPTPRLGLKAIAVNDSIYVIGGKPTLEAHMGGEVEIFHPR